MMANGPVGEPSVKKADGRRVKLRGLGPLSPRNCSWNFIRVSTRLERDCTEWFGEMMFSSSSFARIGSRLMARNSHNRGSGMPQKVARKVDAD